MSIVLEKDFDTYSRKPLYLIPWLAVLHLPCILFRYRLKTLYNRRM